MSLFDDIGRKVTDVGQKTIQKTRDFSDTARFQANISDEEKKINNLYFEIGKMYVEKHRNDCEDFFRGMVSAINESEYRISELKKQIQDIKGVRECPKCGAEVVQGVAYCSSCGNPMPVVIYEVTQNLEDYKRCNNCGKMVKKDVNFCTFCGKPVKNDSEQKDSIVDQEEESGFLICSNCGSKNKAGMAFCTECGNKL